MKPPRVFFACVGNSGRSVMAEAFARRWGAGRIEVASGGTKPLDTVLPQVVSAMAERGIDVSGHQPRKIDEGFVRGADLVITMGCGDDCPAFIGKSVEDWPLADPKHANLDQVRQVRDDVEKRVKALLRSLAVDPP